MLPLHTGARNLEDDCAVLEIGSETLVITHDSMAEGTHWLPGADPYDLAWKLVAVNLSDLAAKGADPIGVLLGYSLGQDDTRFLEGLRAILDDYGVPLLGGDTIKTEGPRTFGLTAIGCATNVPVPGRGGASEGDAIYVTGTLGRAMLGFEGDSGFLEAYNRPRPLLDAGRMLAPFVSAMMDISDGLLLDASRMAKASGMTFSLEANAIPVAAQDRFDDCVRWGDDYQLLFSAPVDATLPIKATRIGQVLSRGDEPVLLDSAPPGGSLGYEH